MSMKDIDDKTEKKRFKITAAQMVLLLKVLDELRKWAELLFFN